MSTMASICPLHMTYKHVTSIVRTTHSRLEGKHVLISQKRPRSSSFQVILERRRRKGSEVSLQGRDCGQRRKELESNQHQQHESRIRKDHIES